MPEVKHPWLWGLSLVATLYFVLRACYSPVWDLAVEDLMLILPASCLYFLAGYAYGRKKGWEFHIWLVSVLLIILVLHIVAACLQLQGGDGFSFSGYLTSSVRPDGDSVTGMYGYYGSFANFAVITGLMCLSLGAWGRFGISLRVVFILLGLSLFS